MKHLKYYDTTAEYTADAPNRTNPTISYDKGGKKIHVDEVIYTSDTKRETWNIYFVDVDGTVLSHQYVEEGGDIEYPADPTHEGYTFVGWNQTATTANSTDFYNDGVYKMIVIGPMYELTDAPEDTTFNCIINTNVTGKTYGVKMACSVATGVTINWGDGSTSTSTATAATNYTHTYTTSGKYNVTIHANDGTYYFVKDSNTIPFMYNFRDTATEIIIGTKCTTLTDFCFVNCGNLKKIKMHKDLTFTGTSQFYNCYNLTELIFPTSLTATTTNMLLGCYNLSALVFPDGFQKLQQLYTAQGMKYVSVPNTISTVGGDYCFNVPSYLFAFSSNLMKLSNFVNNNCIYIETTYDVKSELETAKMPNNCCLTKAILPTGTTAIFNGGFSGCKNLREIEFNSKITSIRNRAFSYCESLRELNIPDTITAIQANTFRNCISLETFKANNITNINTLFNNCYSLRTVETPNITTIYTGGFYMCYSLRNFTIPEGVTTIQSNAFNYCTSLNNITIPSTLTTWAASIFTNCSSLRYVNILSDIGYIQSGTFQSCNSLEIIEFGDNLTKVPRFGANTAATAVGDTTYISTTSLTYIVVPDALYDTWYASTYWANYKQYIIKRSDYESIMGDS